MTLTIQTDHLPLRVDENGVIRVGDSQVLLDIVTPATSGAAAPCPNLSGLSLAGQTRPLRRGAAVWSAGNPV